LRLGGLPVGSVRRLARSGYEALSLLARGLRDQLLGPEAEAATRLGDADLVASLAPAGAELPPELVPRVAAVAAADLRHPVRVRPRLECPARLGGRDEERPLEIDRPLEVADRLGVRRVEDVEALDRKGASQHLRSEARTTHAEQHDGVEILIGDRIGERVQL